MVIYYLYIINSNVLEYVQWSDIANLIYLVKPIII